MKTFKTLITEIEKLITDLEIDGDLNIQQRMTLESQHYLVLSTKQLEDLAVRIYY